MIILTPLTPVTDVSAEDLINGALRLLQVKAADISVPDEEILDALSALNQMVASWANETDTLYQVVRETFTLIPSQTIHTWGPGGNFDSIRPVSVRSASAKLNTTVDVPVSIIDYDSYERISIKSLSVAYPSAVYIDNAYPLANVYVYPVPVGGTINFESYKPLTGWALASDLISLPVGYIRALRFNLAVELASEYQTSAGPDIIKIADESKNNIMRTNKKQTVLRSPLATNSRYNVYTDNY